MMIVYPTSCMGSAFILAQTSQHLGVGLFDGSNRVFGDEDLVHVQHLIRRQLPFKGTTTTETQHLL